MNIDNMVQELNLVMSKYGFAPSLNPNGKNDCAPRGFLFWYRGDIASPNLLTAAINFGYKEACTLSIVNNAVSYNQYRIPFALSPSYVKDMDVVEPGDVEWILSRLNLPPL